VGEIITLLQEQATRLPLPRPFHLDQAENSPFNFLAVQAETSGRRGAICGVAGAYRPAIRNAPRSHSITLGLRP